MDGPGLHDRHTRGELLSLEEQAWLDSWYIQIDADEHVQILGHSGTSSTPTAIQEQINATIIRIHAVAKQIQSTTTENERLRRANLALAERYRDQNHL